MFQVNQGSLNGVDVLPTLENQGFDTSICPEAVCEFPVDYDLFVNNENLDDDNSHPGSNGINPWPLN